jgi:hypothetical protein
MGYGLPFEFEPIKSEAGYALSDSGQGTLIVGLRTDLSEALVTMEPVPLNILPDVLPAV